MSKIVKIVISVVVVAALAVGAYFIFKPHTPPVTDVATPTATEEVVEIADEETPATEAVDEVTDTEAQG